MEILTENGPDFVKYFEKFFMTICFYILLFF